MHAEAGRWDRHYTGAGLDGGDREDWVTRHLVDRPPPRSVLELGCGLGAVCERLHRRGYVVLATDFSTVALEALTARVPDLPTRSVDLTAPLPFARASFGVVVADLCLHYFDTTATTAILREIARVLEADGVLLGRVNSSTDFGHGAGAGQALEPGYYENHGHRKRFFDEPMLRAFFTGWSLPACANRDIRYGTRTKNVWEFAALPPPHGNNDER